MHQTPHFVPDQSLSGGRNFHGSYWADRIAQEHAKNVRLGLVGEGTLTFEQAVEQVLAGKMRIMAAARAVTGKVSRNSDLIAKITKAVGRVQPESTVFRRVQGGKVRAAFEWYLANKEKYTVKQAAEKFGVSHQSVSYHLGKLNSLKKKCPPKPATRPTSSARTRRSSTARKPKPALLSPR